ncbi:MAG: MAPEG family protein [Novosphingobium sp.]
MLLPTTLSMAAAAAIINFWLALRIGRLRHTAKILHGDGGNDLLMRRMRAQANFIENTPLALILIAAIELADRGGAWLAPVAAIFLLGRVAHGIGMDRATSNAWRGFGAASAMLVQIGLAVVAVLIALGRF